ncbi:hypothetical protein CHRY9390_02804 [Chryseobacterium aquaeductus]|uniref:Uncharacterized protein n=1 Tax=Chryseobacterium aquaeductus TaxID=2675056 RepID=A0A9N8QVQ1_9FLAO|nr:hypothetical protein [Chryseobacterium aquaeductus]CAA7332083.1 hypothetical protein CHRY9390_02804 [Chryseobacterium potabilaquae]CAD7814433.1 hypothetical protein CHRY9390_02804 [Chryseobacterium aquaeductus]
MKNIQLIGFILVVFGSFLPLVHVPIIGNWNYWKVDNSLAIACWVFSAIALFGILNNTPKIVKVFGVLLILLFLFTIFATKYQAFSYFSFLPFKSWTETLASTVKLKWGWAVEFLGAVVMLFSTKKKI